MSAPKIPELLNQYRALSSEWWAHYERTGDIDGAIQRESDRLLRLLLSELEQPETPPEPALTLAERLDDLVWTDRRPLVQAIRRCLCCDGTFRSQWAGNRICPRCCKREHRNSVTEYAVLR
jgi:hypothetical protein